MIQQFMSYYFITEQITQIMELLKIVTRKIDAEESFRFPNVKILSPTCYAVNKYSDFSYRVIIFGQKRKLFSNGQR